MPFATDLTVTTTTIRRFLGIVINIVSLALVVKPSNINHEGLIQFPDDFL